ncbi:hypothetical protein ACH5RR_026597 [Cinchona calisaya]|uniref:Uncharacterized protein n=1 Tax=Cinchona calisaya TaxID=153742 RepID=A0ABD2Z6B7_9GENT
MKTNLAKVVPQGQNSTPLANSEVSNSISEGADADQKGHVEDSELVISENSKLYKEEEELSNSCTNISPSKETDTSEKDYNAKKEYPSASVSVA